MNERDLEARMQRIEAALNEIYRLLEVPSPLGADAAAGVALSPPANPLGASDAVVDLIRENNLIAAIKQHRTETGFGLAESKAFVDEVNRQLQ